LALFSDLQILATAVRIHCPLICDCLRHSAPVPKARRAADVLERGMGNEKLCKPASASKRLGIAVFSGGKGGADKQKL
jgi:hypothetical protein